MDREYAKKIINNTTDYYNRISEEWSRKRWRLPSDIRDLSKYIEPGSQVLDLGCGNGYFYDCVIEKHADYTGSDVSANQLKVCKRLHPDARLVLTEPLKLPFEDVEFDLIFCLSTIHHIPTREFQLIFLKEIFRVLKPDGKIFITAWNLSDTELTHEHTKIDGEGNILYPFKNAEGLKLADRFIHAFTLEELTQLIHDSKFKIIDAKVVNRGYGKFSNNLVIAQKPNS